MVGPYDLSGSFGRPGDFEAPEFLAALETIRKVGADSGVAPGIHIVEPDMDKFNKAKNDGYRMIAYSVDIRMLDTTCRSPFADM